LERRSNASPARYSSVPSLSFLLPARTTRPWLGCTPGLPASIATREAALAFGLRLCMRPVYAYRQVMYLTPDVSLGESHRLPLPVISGRPSSRVGSQPQGLSAKALVLDGRTKLLALADEFIADMREVAHCNFFCPATALQCRFFLIGGRLGCSAFRLPPRRGDSPRARASYGIAPRPLFMGPFSLAGFARPRIFFPSSVSLIGLKVPFSSSRPAHR